MALLRRFGLWLSLAVPAFLALGVPARAADVYTVESVAVDVTAKSAAEARPAAMASAQKKAFEVLMRRMLRPEDAARAAALDGAVVNSFVQGVEIGNERASSVRYIANLTVRFSPVKVRDFLKGRSYPYSETMAPAVLVLPLLERDGLRLLWEPENIWLKAWGQADVRNRLIPVVIPRGGAEDQALAPGLDGTDPQSAQARALAARYGAAEALPVQATIQRAAAGAGYVIAVSAPALPSGAPAYNANFAAQSDQDLPRSLEIAAAAVVAAMDGWWKDRTLMRLDEAGETDATVPLRQISDWPEVMRRLDRVSLVQKYSLRTLRAGDGGGEAVIAMNYVGALDQLRTILATAGLVLREDDGKIVLMLQEMAAGNPG